MRVKEMESIMAQSKLQAFYKAIIGGFVVISVAWTCFSVFMVAKVKLFATPHAKLQTIDYPTITLPTLSPSMIFKDLPSIQQSLTTFTDSVNQAVRLSVVFQKDSTYFVELTSVSDCGCPSEKKDRYAITRTAIDPVTGIILTQLREESLSAEGLTRYFGGLTQIRRY